MKTKPKTRRSNGLAQSSPDLMGTLSKAQDQAQGKTKTADELATCFEAEAKRLKGVADILRGKA